MEAEYIAVRKKNGHQRSNRSYADRKYNLRVGPFGERGEVWRVSAGRECASA